MPYQLAVGKVLRQDGRLIEDLQLSREQDCAGALGYPYFLTDFLTQFTHMITEVRTAINVDAK